MKTEGMRCHGQPLLAEEGRDVVVGFKFLVAQLGVLMDLEVISFSLGY